MKKIGYATLDDSTVIKEGIIVYSHALVIDNIPKTLVFTGKSQSLIYEERLKIFLEENVGDRLLYACTHYTWYKGLNNLIYQNVDKTNIGKFPWHIIRSFDKSHKYSKQAAYQELEKILRN